MRSRSPVTSTAAWPATACSSAATSQGSRISIPSDGPRSTNVPCRRRNASTASTDTDPGGRFRSAPALNEAEHHDVPFAIRQPCQRRVQQFALLVEKQFLFGIRTTVQDLLDTIRCRTLLRGTLAPAPRRPRDVLGDRDGPRREGTVLLEVVQLVHHPEPGVLQQIVRVIIVARVGSNGLQHSRADLSDELLEQRLIARAQSIDVDGLRNRTGPFPRNAPAILVSLTLPPVLWRGRRLHPQGGHPTKRRPLPSAPAVSTVKIAPSSRVSENDCPISASSGIKGVESPTNARDRHPPETRRELQ